MSSLYGDWKRVRPKLKVLEKNITKEIVNILTEVAWEYLGLLKAHVMAQDLSLIELSPITVRLKGDTRWWIESGLFLKKLGVKVIYKGKNSASVIAGARPDIEYKNGISMEELATWLEYGTRNIPGRPIFKITDEEFKEKIKYINEKFDKHFEILWNR